MQNHEKKINPSRHVDVAAVKERLFDRHFDEHIFLKELIQKHFPGHLTTNLENSGIAARIAKLDVDENIFDLANDVATTIAYLAAMYERSEQPSFYPHFADCIKAQLAVMRLLDWLYAYGPREVKKQ